ncbi:hypothetical protein PYCC9005_005594 [Savitreella phatthalungensis]
MGTVVPGLERWKSRRAEWTDRTQVLAIAGADTSTSGSGSGTLTAVKALLPGRHMRTRSPSDSASANTSDRNKSSESRTDEVEKVLHKRRQRGLKLGLEHARPAQLLRVYERIVDQRQKPKIPINLAQLMPILKQGWRKNGLWPADAPDPITTDEDDPDM